MSTRLSRFSVGSGRFGEWRAARPLLGGLLLLVGGAVIALAVVFSGTALVPGTHSGVALVAAAAGFLCGTFALARPPKAGWFGVAGIVSVAVSLVGTPFPGLLGVVLSVLGGNLCYAWESDVDADG